MGRWDQRVLTRWGRKETGRVGSEGSGQVGQPPTFGLIPGGEKESWVGGLRVSLLFLS